MFVFSGDFRECYYCVRYYSKGFGINRVGKNTAIQKNEVKHYGAM